MSTLKTTIYLFLICVAFNFLSTSLQGQETLKKPKKLGTTIIKQKEISTDTVFKKTYELMNNIDHRAAFMYQTHRDIL